MLGTFNKGSRLYRQGRRIKMRNANKIKVVGWVALRPNPPAFSGRPQHNKAAPAPLGAARRLAARSAPPFDALYRAKTG